MTTPQDDPAGPPAVSRDAAFWAKDVSILRVGEVPAGAVNLNVTGRRVVGPIQGFGKMWQKTYRVRLAGPEVTPAEVIAAWKADFQSFWPTGNRFYGPLTGIAPGEVALLNLDMPGGCGCPPACSSSTPTASRSRSRRPRGTCSRPGSPSAPPARRRTAR